MPKNLGLYNNDLSVPRKKDIDALADVVDTKYSANNPPPYPVTSVNGQTGAVIVEADLPDGLVKYTPLLDVQTIDTLDADTLQGHNATYFATASGLSAINEQVTSLASGLSTANNNISIANDNISALQSGMANKLDKSGGTMTGALVAQTNTDYSTRQMRNIIISTADPTGGQNGDIWIKYQA